MLDVASAQLERVGVNILDTGFKGLPAEAITAVAKRTGFIAFETRSSDARAPDRFETQLGFSVSGVRVSRALASPGMEADVFRRGDGRQEVRVHSKGEIAGSVAIQFADDSGTVVAALTGYIGIVVVYGAGVSNISYVPVQSSWHWEKRTTDLSELHAVVATAARFGVLQIEGVRRAKIEKAKELTDTIQKGSDPTLGLYAAYACADAGLTDEVLSIRTTIRADLKRDLFDVAMLSSALSARPPVGADAPVPFCPMLSRGWELLRVSNVRLGPEMTWARDHRVDALWTTFSPKGMEFVFNAMKRA